MIFLSKRFYANLRQYASLEESMRVDYRQQIEYLAENEYQRLIDVGTPAEDAAQAVGQAVAVTVTRFPFEWFPVPF